MADGEELKGEYRVAFGMHRHGGRFPNAVAASEWPSQRRCRTCRFWVTNDEPPATTDYGTFKIGQCSRFPPHTGTRLWPPVHDFDWCGEWKGTEDETLNARALSYH
jgi:hypothetical protein